MMKKFLPPSVCCLFILVFHYAQAQNPAYDTLKIMTYNIANYGFTQNGCPTLLTSVKNPFLRTIVGYEDPDILGFEKMNNSPSTLSTDSIIQFVLDSVCNGCYGHGAFTNRSGYSKEDMLYYKTNKLGLLSTTTIYSADNNISDINLHRLYYKSPSLSFTHDTIFLNIIVMHLLSGSGNASDRANEITGVMNWLNGHVASAGNYIAMGDLNTQTSNEGCFQKFISSTNANTKFFDPVNQLGNWNSDASTFAQYLTQSTRINDPGDCAATGGMDNRFDHILCTQFLMDGTDSLQYVPGSYLVVGQDGQHANLALTDPPQNTAVPANVLNALYNMSEHLPVVLKLAVGKTDQDTTTTSVTEPEPAKWSYNDVVVDYLNLRCDRNTDLSNCTAKVFDLQGRFVKEFFLGNNQTNSIFVGNLTNGAYLVTISSNNQSLFTGKFIRVGK